MKSLVELIKGKLTTKRGRVITVGTIFGDKHMKWQITSISPNEVIYKVVESSIGLLEDINYPRDLARKQAEDILDQYEIFTESNT